MPKSLSITEARNKLTELPEKFFKEPDGEAIAITRRGTPVMAILSWEFYESILETIEVISDPDLMDAFRKSLQEIKHDRLIPLEKVGRRLGL